MGFMAGKKALIVGVASDRSIASGIAEAFAREGEALGASRPEHRAAVPL
jgi:enoyl-[acyl-carrier protein] reductase I